MFVTLDPSFLFQPGDEVVFLGENKSLARLEKL